MKIRNILCVDGQEIDMSQLTEAEKKMVGRELQKTIMAAAGYKEESKEKTA